MTFQSHADSIACNKNAPIPPYPQYIYCIPIVFFFKVSGPETLFFIFAEELKQGEIKLKSNEQLSIRLFFESTQRALISLSPESPRGQSCSFGTAVNY